MVNIGFGGGEQAQSNSTSSLSSKCFIFFLDIADVLIPYVSMFRFSLGSIPGYFEQIYAPE